MRFVNFALLTGILAGRAKRVDFRCSGLYKGRLIPVKPRACGGAGEGQALGLPRLYLKFHRHESRRALAYIRQRVGVASWQPFDLAGLEFSGHRAHSFDVAADIEIADRDQQMRTVVMVAGHNRAGFKVDFGHAHSIFHEKSHDAAAGESLYAIFLGPMGWRLP